MANYNKVILAGNLTRDPRLSYTPSQTPVVDFGMAINRRWRGQDGQQREETCFVDCRGFGRQAEVLNQYMSKGRPILVEGRLNFSQWESQDGQKRSKLRVVVERFQFLGAGRAGGQGPRQAAGEQPAAPPTPEAPQNFDQEPPPPELDEGGEDIPF